MIDKTYSRRGFMQFCSATAILLANSAKAGAAPQKPLKTFERVLLVDDKGAPLTCSNLPAEREYVFFYPYASTPCFLLKLGEPAQSTVDLQTEDGYAYQWEGGVGPDRAIVAFSAICAHRLTHPAANVSFIGYRQDAVGFLTEGNKIERRARVIQCCSEHSIYDPAQGARVLSGPAPQPLAAIALQAEDNHLYASGVYGGALFEQFFERFDFRLAMEFGEEQVRAPVIEKAVALPLDAYTRQRIKC